MKKFLFFLMCIFIFLSSNAQTYVPFPKDSARWGIYQMSWGGPGDLDYQYFNYHMSGDTMINGLIYSKIFREWLSDTLLVAFFREDSKRIYIRFLR